MPSRELEYRALRVEQKHANVGDIFLFDAVSIKKRLTLKLVAVLLL